MTRYRADVDGLRAVAVGGVIAFHAFPTTVPGGFVGVDVFFVISGYLISSVVLESVERGDFTLRWFFARRIRRLFPALTTVVLATLVLGWFVMLGIDYMPLGRHAAAAEAFAANIAFWRESGYFDVSSERKPLLHLWSLGVEEQFYLTWPLIVVAATRWRVVFPALCALGLGSFILNLVTVQADAAAAFYLPHTRAWEFLAGAALAYVSAQNWPQPSRPLRIVAGVAGLALIVTAFLVVRPELTFPGWWALLPVGGAVLLLLAGPDTPITILLARPAPVWIGLISYPLYLWHWPLLSLARVAAGGELSLSRRAMVITLSVPLAWLTYRFIERPIRFGVWSRSARTIPSLLTGSAFIAAASVAVAAGAVRTSIDRLAPFASTYTYDYRAGYRGGRCQLATRQEPTDFDSSCVDDGFGRADTTSILLWGDSHAAHLYPGLRAIQRQQGLSLAQYTGDGCKPVGFDDSNQCNRLNAFVVRRLSELEPDVVVLAADWSVAPPLPLSEAFDAIRRSTRAQIIVVGPVPWWSPGLPELLVSFQRQHPREAVPMYMRDGVNAGRLELDVKLRSSFEGAGITYFSPVGILCRDNQCLAVSNGAPTAWDDAHLTDEGSKLIATALVKAIRDR